MGLNNIKALKISSSKRGIWFTSDTHFGHSNIIKFCSRPWKNTEEMDKALISNWNSVVKKDDIVFHLGDFAFHSNSKWRRIIESLNGEIHLVLGNHDIHRWPGDETMKLFAGVYNQLLLNIDNRYVYLNHYPFMCYGGSWRDPKSAVYQLFGHVHSGPKSAGKDDDRLVNIFPYQYDVGVDNNDYKPVSWSQVKEIIQKQIEEGVNVIPKEHTIPDEVYKE